MNAGMYIGIVLLLVSMMMYLIDIAGELKEIRNILREWNRQEE